MPQTDEKAFAAASNANLIKLCQEGQRPEICKQLKKLSKQATKQKKSVLLKAIENRQHELVSLLLEHGANPNVQDKVGDTAIHVALKTGQNELAASILRYDVDVNAHSYQGIAPLHFAAHHRDDDLVTKLILKGANVNSVNIEGRTPLMSICKSGCAPLAKILIQNGASLTQPDRNGWTASDYATLSGIHAELQPYLEPREDCETNFCQICNLRGTLSLSSMGDSLLDGSLQPHSSVESCQRNIGKSVSKPYSVNPDYFAKPSKQGMVSGQPKPVPGRFTKASPTPAGDISDLESQPASSLYSFDANLSNLPEDDLETESGAQKDSYVPGQTVGSRPDRMFTTSQESLLGTVNRPSANDQFRKPSSLLPTSSQAVTSKKDRLPPRDSQLQQSGSRYPRTFPTSRGAVPKLDRSLRDDKQRPQPYPKYSRTLSPTRSAKPVKDKPDNIPKYQQFQKPGTRYLRSLSASRPDFPVKDRRPLDNKYTAPRDRQVQQPDRSTRYPSSSYPISARKDEPPQLEDGYSLLPKTKQRSPSFPASQPGSRRTDNLPENQRYGQRRPDTAYPSTSRAAKPEKDDFPHGDKRYPRDKQSGPGTMDPGTSYPTFLDGLPRTKRPPSDEQLKMPDSQSPRTFFPAPQTNLPEKDRIPHVDKDYSPRDNQQSPEKSFQTREPRTNRPQFRGDDKPENKKGPQAGSNYPKPPAGTSRKDQSPATDGAVKTGEQLRQPDDSKSLPTSRKDQLQKDPVFKQPQTPINESQKQQGAPEQTSNLPSSSTLLAPPRTPKDSKRQQQPDSKVSDESETKSILESLPEVQFNEFIPGIHAGTSFPQDWQTRNDDDTYLNSYYPSSEPFSLKNAVGPTESGDEHERLNPKDSSMSTKEDDEAVRKDLKRISDKTIESLKDKEQRLENLEDQLNKMKDDLKNKANQNEKLRNEKDSLDKKCKDLEKNMDDAIKNLKGDFEKLRNDDDSKNKLLRDLTNDLNHTLFPNEKVPSTLSLEDDVAKAIQNAKQQLGNLNNMIDNKERDRNKLKDDNNQLQKVISNLKDDLKDKEYENAAIADEKNNLKKLNENFRNNMGDELNQLKSKNNRLCGLINELNQSVLPENNMARPPTMSSDKDMADIIDNVINKFDDLNKALEDTENDNGMLQAALDDIRSDEMKKDQDMQEKLDDAKANQQYFEDQAAALGQQVLEAEAALQASSADTNALKSERDDMAEELNAEQRTAQNLDRRVRDLEAENERLLGEIVRLRDALRVARKQREKADAKVHLLHQGLRAGRKQQDKVEATVHELHHQLHSEGETLNQCRLTPACSRVPSATFHQPENE